MSEWNDFYVAVAGASAALTGLIFVGVSISLNKIVAAPILPNRALISLILLLAILTVSILLLVPGDTLRWIGYLLSILGITSWIAVTRLDLKSLRMMDKKYKPRYYSNMLLSQLAIIPYIIGGIAVLANGSGGLYWTVPAIMLSFIKSVTEAWVLLVEINR